jgi:hypothetical protein
MSQRRFRSCCAHASTLATQLYDRHEDRVTLDKAVKINISGRGDCRRMLDRRRREGVN